MKLQGFVHTLVLGVALAALSGCASYPFNKNVTQQARPLTLAQVTASPDAYKGATVIWGGQIIETVNSANGADIYVLQLPLDGNYRPRRHQTPAGRFIAHRNKFSDPEIFKSGRLISVAGTIMGVETQPLQKTQYTYPLLDTQEIHIWRPRPGYYGPNWGWGSGWGPGWPGPASWGPGWDWGWYGPTLYWGPGWDGNRRH